MPEPIEIGPSDGGQHFAPVAIRVLLVDDHSLVTDLVSRFLAADGGFRVESVGDLAAGRDRVIAAGGFDVVLLDVNLPGLSGIEHVIEMVEANHKGAVVLFSGGVSQSFVERAVRAGAHGFIPKTLPLKALTSAIRLVASGQVFVPADFFNSSEEVKSVGQNPLTQLEMMALRALGQGLSNKEIAFRLKLSEPSVKMHVRAVCRKLGARNRTHAVILARAQGLV